MEFIRSFFNELLWILNELSPYILLGFIFAGILHVLVKQKHINKYLGKNNLMSVINASLIGIPLPLCSCGVIPTGISFYKNGASKGASISFLISTPQTGVDSLLATYSLIGLPFAIIRPIIAFVTGIFGGYLVNVTEKEPPKTSLLKESVSESSRNNIFGRIFKYAFVDFLQDLAKWMTIGILLAGLIAVLIPENFFEIYIGNPILEMLIVLIASIPLYVCATGSIPIAAVLMLKGLSPGAALVFLMAGPATNAATITVIAKIFRRKTTILYLTTIICTSIIFGLITNYFLPQSWFALCHPTTHNLHESHVFLPQWFKFTCSVIFSILIINSFRIKYLNRIFKSNKTQHSVNTNLNNKQMDKEIIKVLGMNCTHCKANVEKNIASIDGIKSVEVNLSQGYVTIAGDKINLTEIENIINQLGYQYQGKIQTDIK